MSCGSLGWNSEFGIANRAPAGWTVSDCSFVHIETVGVRPRLGRREATVGWWNERIGSCLNTTATI